MTSSHDFLSSFLDASGSFAKNCSVGYFPALNFSSVKAAPFTCPLKGTPFSRSQSYHAGHGISIPG